MRILVACEYSGVIREAFALKGHDAWSCDLEETLSVNKSKHIKGDVLDLLARDSAWDMIIAHPPCFDGTMLILTKDGYKAIKDIKIGDLVLTHLGRWRKVTSKSLSFSNNVYKVQVTGSYPIITTGEHPFYTKTRFRKFNKTYESNVKWKNIEDLQTKDLIGSVLPPLENTKLDISDEHLWLMGLYVADGCLRFRNNKYEEVKFYIGLHELENFKQRIKMKYKVYIKNSVAKIVMYNKDFCQSFAQFGRSCYTKEIPNWLLSLDKKKASIFLDGYIFGDGCVFKNKIITSSVSKKLSLGISILMRRCFDKPISVQENKRKATTVIEGRTVNQSTSYNVKIVPMNNRIVSSIDKDYTFYPFRKKEKLDNQFVYNISVEEDESYIVDNCIVHNCTYLCNSGAQWYYHPEDKHLPVSSRRPHPKYPHRLQDRQKATDFFLTIASLSFTIPKLCIENPIGIMSKWKKPTQIIQPWQFGHPVAKATCLWLWGLPKLEPTNIVQPNYITTPSGKRHCPWYSNNKGERSVTFQGIADCMAATWG